MGKPRADGQEPDRAGAKWRQPAGEARQARPTRRAELAQHSKGVWYARGGKSGGSAVEQRAITWGTGAKRRWPEANLVRASGREVSRGHSSRENEPGARCPFQQRDRRIAFVPQATRSGFANLDALPRKGVHPMKDRTNKEGIDPATDKPTENAGRRGALESRGGGSRSAAETARRATMEPLKDEPRSRKSLNRRTSPMRGNA
jgi:hypothetical protein